MIIDKIKKNNFYHLRKKFIDKTSKLNNDPKTDCFKKFLYTK